MCCGLWQVDSAVAAVRSEVEQVVAAERSSRMAQITSAARGVEVNHVIKVGSLLLLPPPNPSSSLVLALHAMESVPFVGVGSRLVSPLLNLPLLILY